MPLKIDFQGKSAIVTGAAGAIGYAIAKDLADYGASVLISDIDESRGQAAAASLPNAIFHRADISRREDCRALVDRAVAEWGGVDILINNAGMQHIYPVEEFPEDTWEHMMDVMLIAPFLLTRYSIPYMYKKGWGRIINIVSTQGLVATMYKSGYVAAKHGLMGLTKTVAIEAGGKGVTVNAVCPSFVRTPLVEKQLDDHVRLYGIPENEVIEKKMMAPAAIKRLLDPGEVATYVSFLCSDAAAGITGGAQLIDCGWTAQ